MKSAVALFAIGFAGLPLAFPSPAGATPMHSARSVAQCDSCHIEPTGWQNPETKLRKCSLDCSVCHVSSTGGGMRKPSGTYFGLESLATFGARPSRKADPDKYRDADDRSTPARFRLWSGFSGWWPGKHPSSEIVDRYGNIKPDPRFRLGGDFRGMSYQPLGKGAAKGATFPMQADLYAMGKATDAISMYTTLGYLGRQRRKVAPADKDDPEHIRRETYKTIVAVREVFVKMEGETSGTYVRAGRFNKPHGWRIPDHTSFVRREEGFDQNSQAFGVEAGIAPNYPFANVALFYQGSDDWPGDVIEKGYGVATTFGYRALAAQAGLSFEALKLQDGSTQVLGGPLWVLNGYPVVYIGEVDMKSRVSGTTDKTVNSVYSYNEVDVYLVRGLSALVKYDWLDPDMFFKDDHRHRYTVGMEWNPVNHLQLVAQHRWNVPGDSSLKETREALFMVHAWF